MNQIIFSPQWFFNYDIIFDLLSAIITLVIALYANKLAKFDKTNQYKYFSISFLLIGVGFIAKSLTNFVIYHPIETFKMLGQNQIMYSGYVVSNTPFIFGFFVFRLLQLLGFLGIYLVLTKYKELFYKKGGKHIFIILLFFILITTIFSWSTYYIFYLTLLMFTYPIYSNYRQNYLGKKKKSIKLIALSFLMILASQFIFLFVSISRIFYFLGELIQLIAYLMLAYVFYKIVKK